MREPTVSVVIPAYNQAQFLGDAVQSVLDQTFQNFEVIIVNDASPDNTEEVVKRFNDPRVKYIVHDHNRGLPAARNTGTRTSSGELIALLDADDFYHPEKLRLHVDYLAKHPEIGASYNARFELNHSERTIRELVRPPLTVSMIDFVHGYPFAPSDMVVRREWLIKVGLQNENYSIANEDLDLKARLALAGCKFASVDQALNYRRHHSGKRIRDLAAWMDDVIEAWNNIFSDPRCPADIVALRNVGLSANYLVFSQYALSYGETNLGQCFVREAVRLNPSLLAGNPSKFVEFLTRFHIKDESINHESLLKEVFGRLPSDLDCIIGQFDWAVARGYLLRGVRAVMWDRPEDGRAHFAMAHEKQAVIDESFLKEVAYQLFSYEREFGQEATDSVLKKLSPGLKRLGSSRSVRLLASLLSLNRAFYEYQSGQKSNVPGAVLQAIARDPRCLSDRGVLAIFYRSILGNGRLSLTNGT
jgi:glycosyltransferase involved in cell wall biosynthesis